MKILLVEDDESIAQTLETILLDCDYLVDIASEGQLGWEFAEAFDYDLILLDIMLPKLNGIEFCQRLRSQGNQTPVLLLTAQNSSTKKVIGLDAGADDYVVKPFEISELLARIRVLLRRKNSLISPILKCEKLQLNSNTHEVTYDGQILNLTPKEYRLLELFLRNSDRVLTRNTILDRLWSVEETPSENTVTAHIKDLRRKIKQAGANHDLIETVYGIGYCLKSVESVSSPTAEKSVRQKTKDSLSAVWKKFEDLNSDRLKILEQANGAWQKNTLEGDLLQQAKWAAHRLAGGLGIFGFAEGSRLATEIEELLKIQSTSEPDRARHFSELLNALKNSLKPNLALKPSSIAPTRPLILAVDNHPELVKQILTEMTARKINFKLVTKPNAVKKAIIKSNLDAVVWQFSLSSLTETSLDDFAKTVKETVPLSVILFTNSNNLSDRLKLARLGNNLLLQQSSLSLQAVKATIEAIAQLKQRVAKVLVVDDDPQILAAIRSLIEPWKINLTTLENPRQFWQVIAKLDPDLLILDVAMPNVTGIELCQLVRNDPRWHKLPILFFTVHNDLGTMHQVLTAGANECLSKTLTQSELVTKIFNHLNRGQLLRAI